MSSILLTVNGEAVELASTTRLDELVARYSSSSKGIAVAVDRQIVPRSAWSMTLIAPGSSIEIVAAAAGG